jgi:lipooligosaccharide transport system ATP-binding protein
MSKPLISVRGLTKVFGDFTAVDGIDFDVAKGESFGLLGPNGAGKSTTMRILAATSTRTSGTVEILDKDPEKFGPLVRAHLGVVPQQDNLDGELTVSENLYIYGRYFGLSKKFIRAKIEELLEFAQLEEKRDVKVEALSGGMKRRLTIARGLVSEPDILLLDEPTTGLDPNQLVEIRQLIKNIGKEKTVILSTHIMQEVEAICDRVIIINKGKIVADDKTSFLQQKSDSETIILVEFDKAVSSEKLNTITGIKKVIAVNDKTFKVIGPNGQDLRPLIFNFAVQNNLAVITMQKEENSLESVFRQLTSKK